MWHQGLSFMSMKWLQFFPGGFERERGEAVWVWQMDLLSPASMLNVQISFPHADKSYFILRFHVSGCAGETYQHAVLEPFVGSLGLDSRTVKISGIYLSPGKWDIALHEDTAVCLEDRFLAHFLERPLVFHFNFPIKQLNSILENVQPTTSDFLN